MFAGLFFFGGADQKARKEVPLENCHVAAKVVDFCAEVIVTLLFFNTTGADISDAEFVFPLDERAAVHGFEVTIDGKKTQGVVKEKAEARKTFTDAVARGDSAQLLEQKSGDVFTLGVGNLRAGQRAQIDITYIADLPLDDGAVRLIVPMNVMPRYGDASSDGNGSNSLASGKRGLTFTAACVMSSKITNVRSSTHAVTIERQPADNECIVKLTSETHLTKDLELLVGTDKPFEPRMVVEKAPDGAHTCMLTLVPNFSLPQQPIEAVFVVDRSGSMQDDTKMEQTRSALLLLLKSLPVGTIFNIVSFGSGFNALWSGESRLLSEKTLQEAVDHVSSMEADMGGTALLDPLRSILSAAPVKDYVRQVFVLTDGGVSDSTKICDYVREERIKRQPTTRVFALGLGIDASHALVSGLARAGQGSAEYVLGGDRLETKIARQLAKALQPSLNDVRLVWNAPESAAPAAASKAMEVDEQAVPAPEPMSTAQQPSVQPSTVFGQFGKFAGSLLGHVHTDTPVATTATNAAAAVVPDLLQTPQVVPAVFTGDRMIVFAMIKPGKPLPTSARLDASLPMASQGRVLSADVPVFQTLEGTTLQAMAARQRIRDLEETILEVSIGVTTKDEIVRLGTTYSLASSQTSFVAVQVGSGEGRPAVIAPKSQQPACRALFRNCTLQSRSTTRGVAKSVCGVAKGARAMGFVNEEYCFSGEEDDSDQEYSRSKSKRPAAVDMTTKAGKLQVITRLQKFEGFWEPSKELAQVLGVSVDALGVSVVVTTALVVAFLSEHLSDFQDEWALMVQKANKWLVINKTTA